MIFAYARNKCYPLIGPTSILVSAAAGNHIDNCDSTMILEAHVSVPRRILPTVCLLVLMQAVCTISWTTGRLAVFSRNCLGSRRSIRASCFGPRYSATCRYGNVWLYERSSENASTEERSSYVKMSELNDMDVVVYSLLDDDKLCLGAVQEGGLLSPLSAWTDEPAFGDSIEFLVDEEDRFSLEQETKDQLEIDSANNDAKHTIRIHHLLSEDEVSYGQRQCPRGVHNPHGEESEMVYYCSQHIIDEYEIEMELKPELETLW